MSYSELEDQGGNLLEQEAEESSDDSNSSSDSDSDDDEEEGEEEGELIMYQCDGHNSMLANCLYLDLSPTFRVCLLTRARPEMDVF